MAEIIIDREYYPAIFVARIVNIVIGIIEAALTVRLVLMLFGANPASPFIAWVYGVTGGLLGPFAGAFPSLSLGGASALDIVAILGMIVYAVVGWLILQFLSFIFVSERSL